MGKKNNVQNNMKSLIYLSFSILLISCTPSRMPNPLKNLTNEEALRVFKGFKDRYLSSFDMLKGVKIIPIDTGEDINYFFIENGYYKSVTKENKTTSNLFYIFDEQLLLVKETNEFDSEKNYTSIKEYCVYPKYTTEEWIESTILEKKFEINKFLFDTEIVPIAENLSNNTNIESLKYFYQKESYEFIFKVLEDQSLDFTFSSAFESSYPFKINNRYKVESGATLIFPYVNFFTSLEFAIPDEYSIDDYTLVPFSEDLLI